MRSRLLFRLLLVIVFGTGVAFAGPPMHFEQRTGDMTHQDCMDRSSRVLRSLGYSVTSIPTRSWLGEATSSTIIVVCYQLGENREIITVTASGYPRDDVKRAVTEIQERVWTGRAGGSTSPQSAGCGWVDGMDPRAGADPGRGLTNRQTHFDHVSQGPGFNDVHDFVANRMLTLRECLPRDSYARLYAALSVHIAGVGRQSAGWIDGMDSGAGNDPGRGLSNAAAHANHVNSGSGMSNAHSYVAARMQALRGVLSRQDYAALYANLSVMIARCGGRGECG